MNNDDGRQGSAGARPGWTAEAPKPVESRSAGRVQEGPRATFAHLKPPALNVPKGGGALRGIGETFRTNPMTGTASAQIPLPLTPAPRGPTPHLTLSYDSGQGNGLFGLGWDAAVPQIVRKTDKHLPEYLDSEESDVFLFGGDDLVPKLDLVGSTWVRDAEAVTEGGVTYDVQRYRSRVEGTFSKVERWTHQTARETHWRVTSRDNTTSVFGRTSASRIANPRSASVVYAWLISETRDDRGHVVVYTYKQEDLQGVSFAKTSEAHRKGTAFANRHLKSVRYGNTVMNDPDGSSCRFELVFDYGEHDATAPLPTDPGAWLAREDPFSTYRPGFELRTYRLCRRVLMFHDFEPSTGEPKLVRSLDLEYAPSPKITQLVSAKLAGYTPNGSTYDREEQPALSFGYSTAEFTKKIYELDPEEGRDFSAEVINKAAQWVDLDGEGLPGLLTDRRWELSYKRNLGEGHLAPARTLPSRPNLSMEGPGGAQLSDVAGGGTMAMVRLQTPGAGYHERTPDGWGPFHTFASNPNLNWDDPNLRMVDLNGDGLDDILITRGDHLVWYPSLGRGGFGPARRVPVPRDAEKGPAVIFAGRYSSVFLADMSGDGLSDIVQVLHSRVCYWPNLGNGRFGEQVIMANSPQIDQPHGFHPGRVRFADLDGTGTADLIYLDAGGFHVWQNHSGNGFGPKVTNECFPAASGGPSLAVVDLRGNGMAGLAWATRSAGFPPLRHTYPFGLKKPHLLESMTNGMGLEVKLEYAPSTRFYLADRRAGQPWATKLPFPVHVVSRVETYDRVSKTKLTTTYSYHHGHYDTTEREFRGFARVDQLDAETFDDDTGKTLFPSVPVDNGELAQPPVLTKTWFHVGTWRERDTLSGAPLETKLAAEHWSGDASAPAAIKCTVEASLPADEIASAHRALKGSMLRQEVYGHTRDEGQPDGKKWVLDPVPFTVTEQSYHAVRRQPAQGALGTDRPRHPPVFQPLPLEVRTHTYDQVMNDPRVHQWAALEHDPKYGDVLTSAMVAYGRRAAPFAAAETAAGTDLDEQDRIYALATETDIAHVETGGYRLSIPKESRSYELTGFSAPSSTLASRETLKTIYEGASLLEYQQAPSGGAQRRLVERVRVQYFDTGASWPSPKLLGQVDVKALVYQTYQLDLTDALLAAAMGGHETTGLAAEGGYAVLEAGSYWIRSGRPTLDASHFYLPTSFVDPFENETQLTYDPHFFLTTEIEDAAGNTAVATNDYRVLAPNEVRDPNGNRVEVTFDPLGRVVRVAVKGKDGGTDGDTIAAPTEELTYETSRWSTLQKANRVKRKVRETHGTSPAPRFQESYVYTDGSGRVALTKAQAEPGDAYKLDANGDVERLPDGTPVVEHTNSRWVGSGKTVVNNKCNPVKQYEPYFAPTPELEDDDDLRKWGVTPLITYDAAGRITRFQNPDLTFRSTSYSPWLETASDEHDNQSGNPHAGTPAKTHFDCLGRPFLVQADNGTSSAHVYHDTRTLLDIEGLVRAVKDPLGRTCQTNTFSIGGRLLNEANIDKGTRYHFADVTGAAIRRWDQRDQIFRFVYDELRRPTHLWCKIGAASDVLLERRYYGEAAATPAATNLRGQLILLFDQAGKTELGPFDFKGNLRESRRTLAQSYTSVVDWNATGVELGAEDDPAAAKTAGAALLEAETWLEAREYDALNRVSSLTTPDGSVYLPAFNEAGLLDQVEVQVRGGSATTFVRNIAYDAKGRRTQIEHGSATATKVVTQYGYDPLTFRLTSLVTTRSSDTKKLQDLSYSYDAVGNVTAIADAAHQDIFYDDNIVSAGQAFSYDALYRLTSATGREHSALTSSTVVGTDGAPIQNLPDPNDPQAIRRYSETYEYDQVGNILELFHDGGGGSGTWTRGYTYTSGTNRLASATAAGSFLHDAHGNITSMAHLPGGITYSPFDQMKSADKGGGGIVYFTYDADGQRVRKVWEHSGLKEERLYFGGFEVYRRWSGTTKQLERETLHVMDGVQRIALVETKTVDTSAPPFTPTPRFRVQYTNHLGTAVLECDEDGAVISFEEMHPYGSSAYRSAASASEVSARRYRYTGKERDEETGLDYFGARYYAPWLGRWTTADPLGLQAGLNLYLYGRASPVVMVDPNGKQEKPSSTIRRSPEYFCPRDDSPPPAAQPEVVSYGWETMRVARKLGRGEGTTAQTRGDGPFQTEAEYKAQRAAQLEAIEGIGGVQDPTLGAVGGAIVGTKLWGLKGVKIAARIVGGAFLAGAEGHDDPRIGEAGKYLLASMLPGAVEGAAGRLTSGEATAVTAMERRMLQAEQGVTTSTPLTKSPAPLKAGQHLEAEQLAELGKPKNTAVWRPTQKDMDSAAFDVIVGKAKFTKGGEPKGTIFDSVEGGHLELKAGRSSLTSSYQMRLQVFRSLQLDVPLTIRTSRPIPAETRAWLQRWGVTIQRM